MARPVVLSNGQLYVGLDERGLVHDFYYPYVGLDNLTNARSSQHKIGVWVDGTFSWTTEEGWQWDVDFEPDALVSDIYLRNEGLGIQLQLQDCVAHDQNVFTRRVKVTNKLDSQRAVRVFMHQVFQISRAGRGDTAVYVPEEEYILDYKGRCCLLIGGKHANSQPFDQYSVGNYAIEGKAGTFMDAEDGELSNNPVEHGGVDSVLRFSLTLEGGQTDSFDYWIIASPSQTDGQRIHDQLKSRSIESIVHKTRTHWREWLSDTNEPLEHLSPKERIMAQKSALVIKAHCDERGSILASGDSSIFNFGRDYYCYCWPRDAAYALWPLLRLGKHQEARRFFDFARDTMHPDGYLMHKYQPDRAIGSTWHPLVHGRTRELAIQEDETAIVVYLMGLYYNSTQDKAFLESFYSNFIAPCANFMTRFIDEHTGLPHASYDLWEQKFSTSTYTVCTVIAALEVAAKLATVQHQADDATRWREAAKGIRMNLDGLYHPDGYFRKGLLLKDDGNLEYDDTIDISSLYGPYMFTGLALDDDRFLSTLKMVEEKLLNTSPIGGVIRFPGDDYFLEKREYVGNPWIVCTLWLAQCYQGMERTEEAQALLDWAQGRTYPSGIMSEQFDPETGFSIGVAPLVWSHAEYINTALDLAP